MVGRVDAGKHKVSVSFVNDGSNAREDRNLYVERLLVARDERVSETAFLTVPAAVAAVPRGQGTVVFDMLCWDTEEHNGRKAARYAASLLTALGGDFPPRLGVLFECERMTPQPGMPFFSNAGNHAAMACNGFLETPIEVAASGRYSLELVASGTPAAGVYPLVEVLLDGKSVGQIQLTSGGWRSYYLDLELPQGKHDAATGLRQRLLRRRRRPEPHARQGDFLPRVLNHGLRSTSSRPAAVAPGGGGCHSDARPPARRGPGLVSRCTGIGQWEGQRGVPLERFRYGGQCGFTAR